MKNPNVPASTITKIGLNLNFHTAKNAPAKKKILEKPIKFSALHNTSAADAISPITHKRNPHKTRSKAGA